MMTTIKQLEGNLQKPSPFSISKETKMKWTTMTTREKPNINAMIDVSEQQQELCDALAVVGVIGSSQCKNLYMRSNTQQRRAKALDLGILKQHELIRDNKVIPVYTLGATGMALAGLDTDEEANKWKTYDKSMVLQRLVFFQLYMKFKSMNEKFIVKKSHSPFVAAISIDENEFHVLVVRGNESIIQNYFKYETEIPSKILVVVESITHLQPLQNTFKPFTDKLRVTTDDRLKSSFSEMFYHFKNNEWVLEKV